MLSEMDSPKELFEYCKTNGFEGLGLLAILGGMSLLLTKGTTDNELMHERVSKHYFAYLGAYSVWLGYSNQKQPYSFLQATQTALKKLSLNGFAKGTTSQKVAEFLHAYYRDQAYLALADNYFGPFFKTDVPLNALIGGCKRNLVHLFALWDRWGWDETTFDAAMRDINSKA